MDIESRLLETEMESKNLKSMKKIKTQDIRTERSSEHIRQSYIDEMESERKMISKELRQMDNERKEMKEMLDKLNMSYQQISNLMINERKTSIRPGGGRAAASTDHEASISLHGVFSEEEYSPLSDQPGCSGSVDGGTTLLLREKRDKVRCSEQKLRQTMDRSRSKSIHDNLYHLFHFFRNLILPLGYLHKYMVLLVMGGCDS